MSRKRRGWAEGSIDQLPSGSWRVRVSTGQRDPETGKPIRIVATFATKSEAVAYHNELATNIRHGAFAPASRRMTVAEWLDAWLGSIEATVAARTLDNYRDHATRFLKPHLGAVVLAELRTDAVERMVAKLTKAGASADLRCKVLTTFTVAMNKAVKRGLATTNPVRAVERPRRGRSVAKAMTVEQLTAFLAAAKTDRFWPLWRVWLDSGCRQGELFGLLWSEVDFARGSISIVRSLEQRKNALTLKDVKTAKSRRRVALSAEAVEVLAEHRKAQLAAGHYAPDRPVFTSAEGAFLRRNNLCRRAWEPLLTRAGLPSFRMYDLRHSAATFLLLAKVDARIVSERLGHASAAFTMATYQHVLEGMQDEAARKLGEVFRAASGG